MLVDMPIYEYRCKACAREFEYEQRMSDPDRVTCEACGQAQLERLISWTAVRTTGWQAALTTDNPREAMKGMHVVDTGTARRFGSAADPAASGDPSASVSDAAVGDDDTGSS